MILQRLRDEERGVSAVIVAICLVALAGAAMLSLDAGNLWQSRRNIVTATDATALREAQSAIKQGFDTACVGTGWQNSLQLNAGTDAQALECIVDTSGSPGTGYIKVVGRKPVNVRFGTVVGQQDTGAQSASYAQVGYISEARGIRPMGFCKDNDHVQEWLTLQNVLNDGNPSNDTAARNTYNALEDTLDNNGDGRVDHPQGPGVNGTGSPSYGNAVVHRLYFSKDAPDECGDAPGNWGWYDFDGGSNSSADQSSWVRSGYDGETGVNDCNADGTNGDACSGDPGSSGASNNSDLDYLVSSQEEFAIPLFDQATQQGSNTTFRTWAFLGVKLKGYRMVGAQADRFFDFEFVNLVLQGNCCNPSGRNTGIKAMRICSVDHDPQTAESRCRL